MRIPSRVLSRPRRLPRPQHLRSRGVAVDTIDLYAHGWDPTLSRTQFASGSGYFKPQVEQMRQVSGGVVSEPVGSHLELLQGRTC